MVKTLSPYLVHAVDFPTLTALMNFHISAMTLNQHDACRRTVRSSDCYLPKTPDMRAKLVLRVPHRLKPDGAEVRFPTPQLFQ